MKQIREFNIDNNRIVFINESAGTRSGFKHSTDLYINGYIPVMSETLHYINRTWEAYQFQSVMLSAVYSLKTRRVDKIRADYRAAHGLTGIRSKTDRTAVSALLEQDQNIRLYDQISAALR